MEKGKRVKKPGWLRARFRDMSLKSAFVAYMVAFLSAGLFLASLLISLTTNWEYELVFRYGTEAGKSVDMDFEFFNSVGVMWADGTFQYYRDADAWFLRIMNILSNVAGPVVLLFFVVLAGRMFYKRRLQGAIRLLTESAGKIGANDLDFSIAYDRRDEMGALCGAFETMRSELDRSSREAWRAMEDRKRLNAAFSHDLRTPLTVLKGYAQMLEKYAGRQEYPAERVASTARKMSAHVERLERYVEGMSSLQKLEDLELEPGPVRRETFLAGLREEAGVLCRERDLELRWTDKVDTAVLNLDARQVTAVLENLVGNALRFARWTVEVSCLRGAEYFLLTVTDDGPGFPPETLARACEPFYQGEKAPDGQHFGLGLHICRILCEKHGGGLRVCNAPDGGAMVQASFRLL